MCLLPAHIHSAKGLRVLMVGVGFPGRVSLPEAMAPEPQDVAGPTGGS